MASWRSEILAGVTEVARHGSPGTSIVYGINSDVILTNSSGEVLIAAGEMGKGRCVIFSHDEYTKGFLHTPSKNVTLTHNTKKWVTAGSFVDDSQIENVDNFTDFDKIPKTCKILVWYGTKEKTKAFQEKMRMWIKEGGGFVGGTTPWGYLQLNPDKELEELPLYNVLNGLGMAYTTSLMSGSGGLPVSDNKADNARLDRAIAAGKADINFLIQYSQNIEQAILYLPDRVISEYAGEITSMVKHYNGKIHYVPSKSDPVKTTGGKKLTAITCRLLHRMEEFDGSKKAPKISEFPGDFTSPPTLKTVQLSSTSTAVSPAKVFPTGYYLPAGTTMTVSWSSPPPKPWTVIVGCHSDELYIFAAYKDWKCWPELQMQRELKSHVSISSPFGGLVYVKSPGFIASTFTYTLSNVTPAPRFIAGTGGKWETTERNNSGLWADVSGESFTVTLPSSSIRALPDPSKTMETWDEVINHHLDLRGLDPHNGRGQWVVTHLQPNAGYMHSGYPVVTGMDVADPDKTGDDGFLLNGELLKTRGMWGMFHELGHNLQDSSYTWSGTGEVTCNIFTLYTMDKLTGQKPWEHPWLTSQFPAMQSYLRDGAKFEVWLQKAGVALGIYAQQARDLGWDAYKKLFKEYNELLPSEKPTTDDQKIDQWIERFSKVSGHNLCPMFDFWGFPIRQSVLDKVRHLPAYLQNDETTNEMEPERAEMIRKKYGMSTMVLEAEFGTECTFMQEYSE